MSALPFDLENLLPKESFAIGRLVIPKYGSMTPKEQKGILELAEQDLATEAKTYIAFISFVAKSRTDFVEEDLETLEDVPIHILRDAYEFLLNEFHEWKRTKPEPEGDGEKKEPTGQNSTSDLASTTLTPNSGTAPFTSSELP